MNQIASVSVEVNMREVSLDCRTESIALFLKCVQVFGMRGLMILNIQRFSDFF